MGDYIDREELLTHQYNASHSNWPQLAEMVVGVEDIEDAPAADVAPVVHGHLVHDGPGFVGGVDWWRCSICGSLAYGVEKYYDYCPYCGAKMDGGDGDAAE